MQVWDRFWQLMCRFFGWLCLDCFWDCFGWPFLTVNVCSVCLILTVLTVFLASYVWTVFGTVVTGFILLQSRLLAIFVCVLCFFAVNLFWIFFFCEPKHLCDLQLVLCPWLKQCDSDLCERKLLRRWCCSNMIILIIFSEPLFCEPKSNFCDLQNRINKPMIESRLWFVVNQVCEAFVGRKHDWTHIPKIIFQTQTLMMRLERKICLQTSWLNFNELTISCLSFFLFMWGLMEGEKERQNKVERWRGCGLNMNI